MPDSNEFIREFNDIFGGWDIDTIINKKENIKDDKTKFVEISMLRGYSEIKCLYDLITPLGGFICGGYPRWCSSSNEFPIMPKDIDVYCKDYFVFQKIKRELGVFIPIKYESEVAVTFEKYNPVSSDNHNPYHNFKYLLPIQLIKPIREGKIVANGNLEEILDNFDFTVVRCAIIKPDKVLADVDFLEDEAKKLLRFKNIHCPISSLFRVIKYGSKGYHIRPMEAMKLFLDWDNRPAEYHQKLALYFDKSNKGNLSKEEIQELEELLRID